MKVRHGEIVSFSLSRLTEQPGNKFLILKMKMIFVSCEYFDINLINFENDFENDQTRWKMILILFWKN